MTKKKLMNAEEEEQPKKQEWKKVRKAKGYPSIASSSRTPSSKLMRKKNPLPIKLPGPPSSGRSPNSPRTNAPSSPTPLPMMRVF